MAGQIPDKHRKKKHSGSGVHTYWIFDDERISSPATQ